MEKECGWLDKAMAGAKRFDDSVEERARRVDKALDSIPEEIILGTDED